MLGPLPPSALAALLSRRSVRPRRLVTPGPDSATLDTIVAAGLRGIDHGGLRPWRLLLIEDRERLAAAFAAAEQWLRPTVDDAVLDRARDRARSGPVILALIARPVPDHDAVPEHEQWIAVGAAAQQMLLAADALGFAGSLLSGRKTAAPPLRSALGLAADERLVGFLTFGTAAERRAAKPAAPTDPRTRWSPWP